MLDTGNDPSNNHEFNPCQISKKTFYSHYHLQPQFTQPFNGSNNSVSSGAIKVIELCSVSNYVLLFWTLYYREIYIYPESMKVRMTLGYLIYIYLLKLMWTDLTSPISQTFNHENPFYAHKFYIQANILTQENVGIFFCQLTFPDY